MDPCRSEEGVEGLRESGDALLSVRQSYTHDTVIKNASMQRGHVGERVKLTSGIGGGGSSSSSSKIT